MVKCRQCFQKVYLPEKREMQWLTKKGNEVKGDLKK